MDSPGLVEKKGLVYTGDVFKTQTTIGILSIELDHHNLRKMQDDSFHEFLRGNVDGDYERSKCC